jgi:hypothetical protein
VKIGWEGKEHISEEQDELPLHQLSAPSFLILTFWCFAGQLCSTHRLCTTGICPIASNSSVLLPQIKLFTASVCFYGDESTQVTVSFPSALYVLTLSMASV